MAIVTFLSDFGVVDTYVGQVKGAILSVTGDAVTVVDLTHAVPAQDIQAGAFLLWSAVEVFPSTSVHLAVVDPGVGSERPAVAARARRGDLFVGPDNGLLGPALDRLGGCVAAVELTERRFWRSSVSTTFHGRDVFGPVAGHLAAGVPLEQLGRRLDDVSRPFALPRPDGLAGQVLHIDGYGNLVTNLPAAGLPRRFVVRLGAWQIEPRPHYQAVAPGELLALVGSSGLLEISARDGSAAQATGAQRGSAVVVEEIAQT